MASFLAYPAYFLVAYVALTIALYMLGFVVSKAAFVARLLASVLCLIACALYGAAASIILYPFGKAQISQWATARAFKFVMTATTGLTFEVTDPKGILGSTRPAVFLGNHQSEMDVLMLGAMFPKYCSVAAKSSLRRTPFLGWFMILSGTIFIDRQNSKDARAALSGAVKQIRDKRQSVYMFPEGTRSYSKEPMLLPFKKGAFHLAVQAQVPIVPVVVANYSHVYFTKGGVFKPGKVPIKVLDPISTEGLTSDDVAELTETVQELMMKELLALTEKARGKPVSVPVSVSVSSQKKTTNGVAQASGRDFKVPA